LSSTRLSEISFPTPFAVSDIVVPARVIASPLSPIFAAPLSVVTPFTVSVLFPRSAPVTVRSLFTVVVPVPAPNEIVVAAPPTFNVVVTVLNRATAL
jgi:hypothetical protein